MARKRITAVRAVAAAALALAASCGHNETPASNDPQELALVRVEPKDGESSVARNRAVSMIFNTVVRPESVHDQSIRVRSGGTFQTRPEGSFVVSGNIVEFDPTVSQTGGANSIGFPAGEQILIDIPLKVPGDNEPAENFLQNIEGNPITVASGDNIVVFTTGCGWADKFPGPPGVLGLEFTPGPSSVGQVPADAAVTVVFSEPIDPETFLLGINVFLTNNSPTDPTFQLDIPSRVFFDGSLTRYTLKPVFGFGQGPFNIAVNFIDPDAPETFDPADLPRDLGANQIQNFTFLQTFDTQFDPQQQDVGTITEDFTTQTQMDTAHTDAAWGNDAAEPFALVGAVITTRVQTVNVNKILANGGLSDLPDLSTHPSLPAGPAGEGIYCAPSNPLVGPDLLVQTPTPPTTSGRRSMNLYRAADLGGRGTIIRAAWAPLDDTTTASSYDQVMILMGHKKPDNNLTVQGFSMEFDMEPPVVMANARYSVLQSIDVNNDGINDTGFVDWPRFDNFFDYDGIQDLLVDVQATEGTASQSFRAFFAVSQTPGTNPCICQAIFNSTGDCTFNNSIGLREKHGVFGGDLPVPLQPGNPDLGPNPGPRVYLAEFELAKLISTGTSLYYDSGTAEPDYLSPILGPLVQPCGASLDLRWSGSMDGIVEDVPFTPNIDAVDGMRYIRFEATMRSNLFTRSRAVLRIVTVPFLR